ncbi:MAG: 1-acyl-sn-glycerol-3-phosphate acyltransferase [Clostridiales Family XIII bacterium]|jgi:1-acyl-sn-glycerol-3-phosphate acyltransferase|nr:1-acyl-sn-glycerol-3-phosphate acyltransferase [Clostridiales Family XIII bacterium]
MNVFKTLSFISFILSTLPPIAKHRREIDRARADGRDADEQEWIRLAENFWGPRVLSHWGVHLDRTDGARLPEGGVLFVSNHEGYGDIPAFMDAVREKQFGFVAKDELAKVPIFAGWIVRIRSLMLEREDPRLALKVFAEGEDMLKRGFSLVIFPEGTRAKGQGMKPFPRGSLRMAIRSGAPIVPVATQGSWDCFEASGYPHPGVIRFHAFPPIETRGLSKSEEGALSDQVEALIRSKLGEWADE